MVRGISRSVPGGARAVDEDGAELEDSIHGNRYVGVGVVLGFQEELPVILETYFGGPAHRAGIRPGDVVYEIDGLDTRGMERTRFIGYSRGELDTELVYVVGRPDAAERRSVRMTRGVVPRETVVGSRRGADERWEHDLPSARAAYVKLTALTASTAHELRGAFERIERGGPGAVVLDLRDCHSTHVHAAAMVADLFRRDALMGAIETRARRSEYRAGPDAVFDAARMVLLVDGRTRGATEWLAKVLKLGGAGVVGLATPGIPFLYQRVDVPGWSAQVSLATGWMLEPGSSGPLRGVQPDLVVEDPQQCLERALAWLAEATSR